MSRRREFGLPNVAPEAPPPVGSGVGRIFRRTAEGEVALNPASDARPTDTYVFPSATADGAGARTYFDPVLAAFRAGRTTGRQWDRSAGAVGADSWALGVDGVASGAGSIVLGGGAALDDYAVVCGGDPAARAAQQAASTRRDQVTIATGQLSVLTDTWTAGRAAAPPGAVFLDAHEVRATNALACGRLVVDSTAAHLQLRARDAVGPAAVRDHGHFWVRDDAPECVPIFTDNLGRHTVLTGGAPTGAFFSVQGSPPTTIQSSGQLTHDFSFGARSTECPPPGERSRFMFDKARAAFRAGRAGAEWDAASRGVASAAFGAETTASGARAFAAGDRSVVSGDDAAALGSRHAVSGACGFAAGSGHVVAARGAAALGSGNTATGRDSLVCGAGGSDGGHDRCLVWSDTAGRVATADDQVVLGATGGCFVHGPLSAPRVFLDGPTGTTELSTAATVDYALRLPERGPAPGQTLVTTTGPLVWATPALAGGNALGAALQVGTNDPQSLELRTNGRAAVTVDLAGAVTVANSLHLTNPTPTTEVLGFRGVFFDGVGDLWGRRGAAAWTVRDAAQRDVLRLALDGSGAIATASNVLDDGQGNLVAIGYVAQRTNVAQRVYAGLVATSAAGYVGTGCSAPLTTNRAHSMIRCTASADVAAGFVTLARAIDDGRPAANVARDALGRGGGTLVWLDAPGLPAGATVSYEVWLRAAAAGDAATYGSPETTSWIALEEIYQ